MIRLIIPESLEKRLRSHLLDRAPLEHGAALLLGHARSGDVITVLVREIVEAPADGFRLQNESQWAPSPAWLSRLVGKADEHDAGVALVHSHPMSQAAFRSAADAWADELVAPYFANNLGSRPFCSLVLTSREIVGAAWVDGREMSIESVRVPGAILRDTAVLLSDAEILPLHTRQSLAFGAETQQRLRQLHVSVVGVGGTGSSVAEQLARLGVGHVQLVDNDVLEASNISRVFGSTTRDIGKKKVDVVAHHLRAIGSGTSIDVVDGDIRMKDVVKAVTRSDVIFSCTDNHSSRAVLNDVAYQYMIPTFDIGVRIGTGKNGPTSIPVEIRVLRPDTPCLWCLKAIDGRQVAAELMPDAERLQLEREGYVQSGGPAATVVPYTNLGASLAASAFLSMCAGFASQPLAAYTFDALSFDGWNWGAPLNGCVCLSRLGLGDARPVWLKESEPA